MVTIEDISNKCIELTQKHKLPPEAAKDFLCVALLAMDHCREIMTRSAVEEAPRGSTPYIQPWGGHQ